MICTCTVVGVDDQILLMPCRHVKKFGINIYLLVGRGFIRAVALKSESLNCRSTPVMVFSVTSYLESMVGENRQLVTDESVEFEK